MLDAGGLDDPVAISIDRSAWQEFDGSGTSGLVSIGVTLEEALDPEVAASFRAYREHLDAGNSDQVFELAPLNLSLVGLTDFDRSLFHDTLEASFDNLIVGTYRSETLIGTEARDLIIGLGGNDVLKGLGSNDILIGGPGNDTSDGGLGNDIFVFMGTNNGYDSLDGGEGLDRAVAVGTGTTIGVNGYAGGVEAFEGTGDTIIRDSYRSHTLDFSNTRLDDIAEVDAGSGNDTIIASNLSPAAYRGGSGNDKLYAGSQNTTWLYSGTDGGYDKFGENGAATVIARAETAGTLIGIKAYENDVDAFEGHADGDTVIRDSYHSHTLDFSKTRITNISEVDAGSGNDTIIASNLSPAAYRGGAGNDQLYAGSQDTTWLYAGNNGGYDMFGENGAATVIARAETAGTSIGIKAYENGVDAFEGHVDGDTVIRNSYYSHTLDFSETRLANIAEVDAGSGNDTIIASNASPGSYRGGSGNDNLFAGSQDTVWLYSGEKNGYDALRDNGPAVVVARAESAATVIGIGSYENGVDAFEGHADGDTVIRNSYYSHTLDFSETRLDNIAEVDAGSGNDTLFASNLSPGAYRGGSGNDTLIAGTQPTTWLYAGDRDGLDSFQHNGNADVQALLDGAAGTLGTTQGTTDTGLDRLVDTILADPGLNRKVDPIEIAEGAAAADAMNNIIIAAIKATGLANDGEINTADVYDLNAWIQSKYDDKWTVLHGDDETYEETGFHLVQNDGATTLLFGPYNAVNTVADGIYHMGFDIVAGRFLNEDGNRNVSVELAAHWLGVLLRDDLANGALGNPDVDPYAEGTTGTGLDSLVEIVVADPGLNRNISTSDITAGATAADKMNQIIVAAIKATGLANDGKISAADVRDLNAFIQENYHDRWVRLHGDDEDAGETGFHLVQNDGATTRLYDNNAVNTVADGIYHLGFDVVGNRLLNEDGNANARVETVAWWLSDLLEKDLADGSLVNLDVNPYAEGTTGTGLDGLVEIIVADPVLNRRIATNEITAGATAADKMNRIIVAAIKATGLANDGSINTADVRDLNAYIQENHYNEWVELHGDDEGDEETGFHLVQNDGAITRLYGNNAVNTVADGIYHLGFDIVGERLLNEDGNANARVETVAWWLNDLLADDFAAGTLSNPDVDPYAKATTGTGLDSLVELIAADQGLNLKIATSEITAGATAADEMNQLIIEAIKATGAANDGEIDRYDLEDVNAWLQTNHYDRWVELHGDDEVDEETGFHLVQNDGAITRLFASNAVNTVADGIFHVGFNIEAGRFLNEDGDRNVRVEKAAYWLNDILEEDLQSGELVNLDVVADPTALGDSITATLSTAGTTGTGLDTLVDIILNDPGLNRRIDPADIAAGAEAADAMSRIIVAAITATGLANDGEINTADMYDLNAWIQANHHDDWVELHGDDEPDEETGFHLVQNDGATTRLFANNAVNTVADGIFHVGFDIEAGRFLNEDGNRNVSVETAALWLNELLQDDLAGGALANPDVDPYAEGTTDTGLDSLVETIVSDPGLNRKIATSEITAGATAADKMNQIIVTAIKATGLANDGEINTADVRDLNAYIQTNHYKEWVELHGDDEDGEETGFHLVQNDGATTRLYDNNAVNTVADGIYHLGFDIVGDRLLNEDGNANARVETVAWWLSDLLKEDLAAGTLVNPDVGSYAEGTTGTGLDSLVEIIVADPSLNQRIATSEVTGGATAADKMNRIIVAAIKATGLANDGQINTADVRDLNAYIQDNHHDEWVELHGDDEDCEETGFHLVQNDGATTRLYDNNAVNTVADGIYHLGFDIVGDRLLNEDGNANARVETVAWWLSDLLKEDLAAGTLSNPDVDPYANATTGTGLDKLVDTIVADQGLNRKIATSEITAGATAADEMNQIIIEAIKATGAADDGKFDAYDVINMNVHIQAHHQEEWTALHGDDEGGEETGFHLVQNDGASTRLFAENAVNTVADGIYHLGFDVERGSLQNEDGNRNARLEAVAHYFNELLRDDLASGALSTAGMDAELDAIAVAALSSMDNAQLREVDQAILAETAP